MFLPLVFCETIWGGLKLIFFKHLIELDWVSTQSYTFVFGGFVTASSIFLLIFDFFKFCTSFWFSFVRSYASGNFVAYWSKSTENSFWFLSVFEKGLWWCFHHWFLKIAFFLSFVDVTGLNDYQFCLVFQRTNFFIIFILIFKYLIHWFELLFYFLCSIDIATLLSRTYSYNVNLFIWCLTVNLMNELNDINFPLTVSSIGA